MIFQPQIRVVCDSDSTIVPIRIEEISKNSDDFNLLYKERCAKARGHLCGAMWKEIDPERVNQDLTEMAPPFYWVDGENLSGSDREKFSNPDVRTEYLPNYSIEQASLSGPQNADLKPISAESLANSFEFENLQREITPLINEYEKWINEQSEKLLLLDEIERKVAEKKLIECRQALTRMRQGLGLLETDPDVRVAFCFMNQAMHLQSIWKNTNKPLKWHLFQIAFILQNMLGISKENHPDRVLCDLLWFPTGAGKTEAYLGLAAFAIALRKRRAIKSGNNSLEGGVVVLSRYTLRLLTIQQFRRALSMITACEYLRVTSWAPLKYGSNPNPWGTSRISIGLWVGAGVTPNHLTDWPGRDRITHQEKLYLGAIGELYGRHRLKNSISAHIEGEESEPAQVLKCPVCNSILAVSSTTLIKGENTINWLVSKKGELSTPEVSCIRPYRGLSVKEIKIKELPNPTYHVISVTFDLTTNSEIEPYVVDAWWDEILKPTIDPTIREEFARPSRPGYFYKRIGLNQEAIDFEIHCVNPNCQLNKVEWFEKIQTKEKELFNSVLPPFATSKNGYGLGIPIPAFTVDDQIYGRCPSMIVATVDKFARLAFEPRASALFGNVTHFNFEEGYSRDTSAFKNNGYSSKGNFEVFGFLPPCLVIQDELHLIEGPLGSMVGLFETGVDILATHYINGQQIVPKYVASTATIKQADQQVRSLFNRQLAQFPPLCLDIDDNFFAISREPNQLESSKSGRLYVGICAPGRGAQTPLIRIWASILDEITQIKSQSVDYDEEIDQFTTIVGYFNAKRELAGAIGLFKQDIPERLTVLSIRKGHPKHDPLTHIELSGRTESVQIPGKLDRLSKENSDVDALFCTSMFGTGVDVDRLGLMIVHGQPKTTANYIQATGRVGRKRGGLVLTFLRSTRPRDLDHYEFFTGYHRSLHRYVEPITVYPFSPGARERGLGPLAVLVLRNAIQIAGQKISPLWAPEERKTKKDVIPRSGSRTMKLLRRSPEIQALVNQFELRSNIQPVNRNPGKGLVKQEIISELDRWEAFARSRPDLMYSEITMTKEPVSPVVLGDPAHSQMNLPQVYKNAPQSLREVEGTTTFDDEV